MSLKKSKISQVLTLLRYLVLVSIFVYNNFVDESTCALTSNGDIFVWGRNNDNLFSLGERRLNIIDPTRVRFINCV